MSFSDSKGDKAVRFGCLTVAAVAIGLAWLFWELATVRGPDWLLAEARSPDQSLVARLWCADFCDVPEASTLTISPASRQIALERPAHDEFLEGRLPDEDAAFLVFRDGPSLKLRWVNSSVLIVEGRCLREENFNARANTPFRGVKVRFLDVASPPECNHRG